MIKLSSIGAFSSGGNRLCFIDPSDDNRCIKLARPDRTPEKKRAAKAFPGNLRTLDYFDENVCDMYVYEHIETANGQSVYQVVPRCYGYVETSLGRGLSFEMIRDSDDKISLTLQQYVWQFGWTDTLTKSIKQFQSLWQELAMPSRNLLLHNILVQQIHHSDYSEIHRLVVIDGLGWPDIIPLAYYIRPLARFKAKRKSERLIGAVNQLIAKKQAGKESGTLGWLDEDKR